MNKLSYCKTPGTAEGAKQTQQAVLQPEIRSCGDTTPVSERRIAAAFRQKR
jgi:hypothetical protein